MTTFFYVSFALLWLLVLFESLVLFGVLRTVYRGAPAVPEGRSVGADRRLIGQPVPPFSAVDVLGRRFDERSLPRSLNALLFVSPDCVSCMASLEEVAALRAKVDGALVVVCRAGADECRELREAYALDAVTVLVDEDGQVSSSLGVAATPTAVLIGANGRIRTFGHPADKDELARMIAAGNGRQQLEGAHERD